MTRKQTIEEHFSENILEYEKCDFFKAIQESKYVMNGKTIPTSLPDFDIFWHTLSDRMKISVYSALSELDLKFLQKVAQLYTKEIVSLVEVALTIPGWLDVNHITTEFSFEEIRTYAKVYLGFTKEIFRLENYFHSHGNFLDEWYAKSRDSQRMKVYSWFLSNIDANTQEGQEVLAKIEESHGEEIRSLNAKAKDWLTNN